jgi:hypothetical protein
LFNGVMTPSAKESSEMERNTNTVTYLQLSLYVTPYVKMRSDVRDIFDMYGISSNLGDQLCTRLESESSQFRTVVS